MLTHYSESGRSLCMKVINYQSLIIFRVFLINNSLLLHLPFAVNIDDSLPIMLAFVFISKPFNIYCITAQSRLCNTH